MVEEFCQNSFELCVEFKLNFLCIFIHKIQNTQFKLIWLVAALVHHNILNTVVTLLSLWLYICKVLNINVTFMVIYFFMVRNAFLTLVQEAVMMRAFRKQFEDTAVEARSRQDKKQIEELSNMSNDEMIVWN